MPLSAPDIAVEWDNANVRSLGGATFNELHKRLTYYEGTHYSQYLPTVGTTYPDFSTRFERWLECVPDESERRLLFEFAPDVTFFTREDFAKLYQSAISGPITRWIIDILGLSLSDTTLDDRISNAIHYTTWFCPLSDSMAIADFHHANLIGGIPYRPDWRSLAAFSERQRIVDFMAQHEVANIARPLQRIVLLEDFIGAGWQLGEPVRVENTAGGRLELDVVDFAGALTPIEFLIVPLITCPTGAEQLRKLVSKYPNVRCEPVLELGDAEFIHDHAPHEQDSLFDLIRALAHSSYALVKGNDAARPRPYGPFGNGGIGARVVMYSNTPAGSLPMIQHPSDTWKPPFPRSARVK